MTCGSCSFNIGCITRCSYAREGRSYSGFLPGIPVSVKVVVVSNFQGNSDTRSRKKTKTKEPGGVKLLLDRNTVAPRKYVEKDRHQILTHQLAKLAHEIL